MKTRIGMDGNEYTTQERKLIDTLRRWGFSEKSIREHLEKCIRVKISRNGGPLELLNGGLVVSSGETVCVKIEAKNHHDYFFMIMVNET